MTVSSIPWPRPLVIFRSEIFPVASMTMSTMTSPFVPLGSTERSGFGVGKKLANAMSTLPEPSASAPTVESGCAETGEFVLGDAVVGFVFTLGRVGSGDLDSASCGAVFGVGRGGLRGRSTGQVGENEVAAMLGSGQADGRDPRLAVMDQNGEDEEVRGDGADDVLRGAMRRSNWFADGLHAVSPVALLGLDAGELGLLLFFVAFDGKGDQAVDEFLVRKAGGFP